MRDFEKAELLIKRPSSNLREIAKFTKIPYSSLARYRRNKKAFERMTNQRIELLADLYEQQQFDYLGDKKFEKIADKITNYLLQGLRDLKASSVEFIEPAIFYHQENFDKIMSDKNNWTEDDNECNSFVINYKGVAADTAVYCHINKDENGSFVLNGGYYVEPSLDQDSIALGMKFLPSVELNMTEKDILDFLFRNYLPDYDINYFIFKRLSQKEIWGATAGTFLFERALEKMGISKELDNLWSANCPIDYNKRIVFAKNIFSNNNFNKAYQQTVKTIASMDDRELEKEARKRIPGMLGNMLASVKHLLGNVGYGDPIFKECFYKINALNHIEAEIASKTNNRKKYIAAISNFVNDGSLNGNGINEISYTGQPSLAYEVLVYDEKEGEYEPMSEMPKVAEVFNKYHKLMHIIYANLYYLKDNYGMFTYKKHKFIFHTDYAEDTNIELYIPKNEAQYKNIMMTIDQDNSLPEVAAATNIPNYEFFDFFMNRSK